VSKIVNFLVVRKNVNNVFDRFVLKIKKLLLYITFYLKNKGLKNKNDTRIKNNFLSGFSKKDFFETTFDFWQRTDQIFY
jgi:hypothetical protein